MEVDKDTIAGDENENLNDEDVVYQINSYGADFDVDGLVKRFSRGDIFKPNFQRSYVWTHPQASKFIESILLGLPIPSIFLYREEETQKYLIVDGLQRLTTLNAFAKNRWPTADRGFKLKDVKSRFEGQTIEDLAPEDRRRFEDAVIHAMIIQQLTPEDNSSAYYIFDRLNSNGTPLQPQEIRAAVYHGAFQDLISELNDNESWRTIFGSVHKRGKDHEFILRFLALVFSGHDFKKPMKKFLNNFMEKNRKLDSEQTSEYKNTFEKTIDRVIQSLGEKPFRPSRNLNVSVFDSMMVGIAKNPNASSDAIRSAYDELVVDSAYIEATTRATTDEANVALRLRLATETIKEKS